MIFKLTLVFIFILYSFSVDGNITAVKERYDLSEAYFEASDSDIESDTIDLNKHIVKIHNGLLLKISNKSHKPLPIKINSVKGAEIYYTPNVKSSAKSKTIPKSGCGCSCGSSNSKPRNKSQVKKKPSSSKKGEVINKESKKQNLKKDDKTGKHSIYNPCYDGKLKSGCCRSKPSCCNNNNNKKSKYYSSSSESDSSSYTSSNDSYTTTGDDSETESETSTESDSSSNCTPRSRRSCRCCDSESSYTTTSDEDSGENQHDESDQTSEYTLSSSESDVDASVNENSEGKLAVTNNPIETYVKRYARQVDAATNYGSDEKLRASSEVHSQDLKIDEIKLWTKINLHKPVTEWVSNRNRAVGRYENTLILVTLNNNGDFKINYEELGGTVTSIFMLDWWNEEEKTLQIILITSEDARVNWHHYTDENMVVQLWSWELIHPISNLKCFSINNDMKCLVTFVSNSKPYDIFGAYTGLFGVIPFKEWWLEQNINGSGKPSITNDGKMIAIPSLNDGKVYLYEYQDLMRKYNLFHVFDSAGVENSLIFESNLRQFLAIGGDNSSIVEISPNGIQAVEIESYNFDHIESFLPVKTNSSNILLIIQHSLNHKTHMSISLEGLQWKSNSFHVIEHPPCNTDNEKTHGFVCISDHLDEMGIVGTAIIENSRDQFILTANREHTPLLYHIEITVNDFQTSRNVEESKVTKYLKKLRNKINILNWEMMQVETQLGLSRPLIGRLGDREITSSPLVEKLCNIWNRKQPQQYFQKQLEFGRISNITPTQINIGRVGKIINYYGDQYKHFIPSIDIRKSPEHVSEKNEIYVPKLQKVVSPR